MSQILLPLSLLSILFFNFLYFSFLTRLSGIFLYTLGMIHFEDILASLNPKQREAVETLYGPVLVIAWPGSGKTQLLSARIANILKVTDYLPSNILCLTFTDNAAKNMRERLATMIGQDAYKVAIHTFHSFGSEILNRFRYLTKEYNDARPVDTIESSSILDDILEALPWDNPYKPWYRASDTIREVKGTIDNLKKWGITPALYREILTANKETIALINPIIESYWSRMDALGRTNDDKQKKIWLFQEFTNIVQQMFISSPKIGGYESFGSTFMRSIDEAWETYEWDGSIKHISNWAKSWTELSHTGTRWLKETTKLAKQEALVTIFEAYQGALKERWLIDFSDMILEAITLIESNPIVRMSLAEQYQFVMIDEFQDTNEAQMRLIDGILSVNPENPNIFAVGDDDQSIYKFQWANTKNIRDFHDAYSDTKLIILEENYRSKHEIITHSRTVIKSELNNIGNIFDWAVKIFRAQRGEWWEILKNTFRNELEEISWIVDDVEKRISLWVKPSDIAIISRKNKTLELIGKGLLEKNIRVVMSKDESIFDSEEIILLVNILRLLSSLDGSYKEEDAELLVKILSHPCFSIDRLTLWNISKSIYHARKETTKSWIETLAHHEDERVRNTANFFRELSQKARTERLETIIDYITGANTLSIPDEYDEDWSTNPLQIDIFSERADFVSPLYTWYFGQLSDDKWTKILYARYLANIKALIDRVRSYKNNKWFLSLNDAIELLGLIDKYAIDIETSHIIGDERSSVNLITVYKAKWLEWDTVYVPFVTKSEYQMGRYGGSPLPKNLPLEAEKDDDADIERLVYTAFTRAKNSLVITYSKESMTEKSLEPLACIEVESEWWEEVTSVPLSSLTASLEGEKKELFSLPYLSDEQDFLKERIEKHFVMNATALQNFLNIADAGPEYFVANTLLRFPQSKSIAASYGSAIHKALEDFFTDYKTNKSYKKQILFESFSEYLKKEWFDKQTEDDYLARGKENLESLYSELTKQSYGDIELEYDFRSAYGGVFLPVQNGDGPSAIQLTGKIDRIEKKADDTLIITDYKTGWGFDTLDGKWSSYEKIKQWKYRLQLCFYAILFELSPRWRMFEKKQYELFFVEKNRDEDRFHRVVEYLQSGEIERTKKLIIAVMSKIQDLDFPDVSQYEKSLDGIRQFEEDLIQWNI